MILKRQEYHDLQSALGCWEAWAEKAVKGTRSKNFDAIDKAICGGIEACRKEVQDEVIIHDINVVMRQMESDWKSVWHINNLAAFALVS